MDKRRIRNRNNKLKKEKKFNWSIIIKCTIFLCIIFLASFFSILNIGNSNIINNIYINGISVSSLSREQAKEKLEPLLEDALSKEILIKYDNYETTILPAEIDFSYDIGLALEEAYSIGRTGNILSNNFRILISLFKKTNIEAPITYDSNKLENIINNISVEIPNLVVEPSYYISNDSLILTKGSAGNYSDKEQAKQSILSGIKEQKDSINLSVAFVEPQSIDINKIHSEIYSEPQNASITQNPYSISAEQQGIDFAISIEEAQNLIDTSDSDQVIIPLTYTDAEITVSDLGEDIFGNIISTCTTKYDSTNTNRVINLQLAADKINGTIINPGETFSFNKIVGERTTKNGFAEAIIYADGELDYGIGGGICQISSTLYNSVLLANLEIVERKNHSMTVTYLPLGHDATVSYGSVDFKFKNNRSYPIKISATLNSGVITISICGVKEKNEYSVDIVVETTQVDDFETVYEYSSSLAPGTQYIKQTGKYGYKCSTYRVLSQNGKVVSKTLISTDTYKPQKQIVVMAK